MISLARGMPSMHCGISMNELCLIICLWFYSLSVWSCTKELHSLGRSSSPPKRTLGIIMQLFGLRGCRTTDRWLGTQLVHVSSCAKALVCTLCWQLAIYSNVQSIIKSKIESITIQSIIQSSDFAPALCICRLIHDCCYFNKLCLISTVAWLLFLC